MEVQLYYILIVSIILDGAAEEKVRLEEKQRSARKERKKFKEDWKPRYDYTAVLKTSNIGHEEVKLV